MMEQISNVTPNIEELIADTIAQRPYGKDILIAFQPVIVVQRLLIEKLAMKKAKTKKIDGMKFKQGVPVIRQFALFASDDPWDEIAAAVMPSIVKGFPALTDDMTQMGHCLKNGNIRLFNYFCAVPDEAEKIAESWSSSFNISQTAIYFFLSIISRIILEIGAKSIAGKIKDLNWEKGYCPICGAHPAISWIEEKGSKRWLHCAQCGWNWMFSRVICPYCENEAQQGMDYFYVESRPQESAFTCDKCKRYLVTLNRISELNAQDFDVAAISLAYLDIIMQNKGFTPMTTCNWNSF